MTVKERLIQILTTNGMSEQQAQEVMKIAMPILNDAVEDYEITFNAPFTDYPNMMYSLWWNDLKPIALKWIDENKPQAWFRMMFVNDNIES